MPVTSDGVDGSGAYAEAMASEEADAVWIRRVALLLVGQAFSLLGSSIVQYAIWWWIVLQTRTGSAMLLAAWCRRPWSRSSAAHGRTAIIANC